MLKYIKDNFDHFDHIQDSIKKIADKNYIPIIKDDVVLYIESLLSLYDFKNILELGSGLAYSTYAFAKHSGPKTKVFSVDISNHAIEKSKNILISSKYITKITWIESDAYLFLKNHCLEKYDLIFIDALKSDYPKYIKEIINKKDKYTILIDNLYMNALVKNKDSLKGKNMHLFNKSLYQIDGSRFTFLSIGDGLGLLVKK